MAVFSLNYNNKHLESFPIGMGDTFMIGRQSANDIRQAHPAVFKPEEQ